MYEKLTPEQKSFVDSLLNSLTEDEKIGQMVNEHIQDLVNAPDSSAYLRKYPLGSFFGGSEVIDPHAGPSEALFKLDKIFKESGIRIPPIVNGDFETGIGGSLALPDFVQLCQPMGLGATFSEQDAYDYGRIIGEEASLVGIRWCFGPVSDLNVNRENPVTNVRSVGEDPDRAIPLLRNIIRGMQDSGCAATAKHFPGDGVDTRNQHLLTSLNTMSRAEWEQKHGKVFKALIDAGVYSIMVGHIAMPEIEDADPKTGNWRPATASRKLMTDLLRNELGFRGIIITDALGMGGYENWAPYEKRIIETFNAGADVFLWPNPEKFFPLIKTALRDGKIVQERLDESVRRILSFKVLLGMFDPRPSRKPEEIREMLREHKKTAQRITEHSLTLLRNRKNVIPLKLKEGARILVITASEETLEQIRQASVFADELRARKYEVLFSKISDWGQIYRIASAFDATFLISCAMPKFGNYRPMSVYFWGFMVNHDIRNRIIISFGSPYFLYDLTASSTYINAYGCSPETIRTVIKAVFGEIPFTGHSPVGVPYCFNIGDGIMLPSVKK